NKQTENIDFVLNQRNEEENLLLKIDVKGKKARKLFLLVGNKRAFFFKPGGKLEVDYHFLDIMEVKTDNPKEVQMKFRSDNGKEPLVFAVDNANDSAEIVLAMDYLFTLNFPGMKTNRMKIIVLPDTRVAEIYSSPNAVTPEIGPCAGLSLTYSSMCDFMNVQPISEVIWHIDYVLNGTDVKDFDYGFFFKKDRLLSGDARPLMAALAINTWFNSFTIKSVKLSTECIGAIISLVGQSTSFEKININGVGFDRSSCEKLVDAIASNKALPLKELDLGNNQIEDKGMIALADMLKTTQLQLSSLILEGCGVGRAAMSALGEALGANDVMLTHLKYLDISGNKLESEGSNSISNFLVKSKSLRTFKIASTQPLFHQLKKCATITTFDNSGNRIVKKDSLHLDMVRFLNHSLHLTNLNLSRCQMPIEVIQEVFGEGNLSKLETLNIAENDLGDEGISIVCDLLASHTNLKSLDISGNFIRRSKVRTNAIESIINMVEKKSRTYSSIKTLIIQGGSKSQLKGDLLPIICSLYYNSTLKELDISGHSIGDIGAAALGKLLQSNFTLEKLEWDDNSTTARGLMLFKLGLLRNSSLCKMPIPMRDIATSLKSDNTPLNIQRITELVGEIQQQLLDNLAKNTAQSTRPKSMSAGTLSPPKPRSSSTPTFAIDPKMTTATCAGLKSFSDSSVDSEIIEPLANLPVK
ncbi:hypothetical protein SAMD00019534_019150, partial [Acytostelium subglobosum LB1]|uniref:hypothetical protein n=1 Tax=Acytostelium subglobosum LB1 TaxID=1410327 RepID=UPI000644BE3F